MREKLAGSAKLGFLVFQALPAGREGVTQDLQLQKLP
jgi:hypothetical protein